MVTSVEAEEKRFNTSGVLLEYFDYLKTWMLFADDFDDSGASDNGSSAHGPHGVAEYENNPGSESPGSEGSTKRHRGVSTSVATLITDVSRVLAMQDAEKAREKWVESRLLPLLEQETNTGNIRGLVLAVEADAENENFEKPIQVLTTVLSNLKCVDSIRHKVEADVSAATAAQTLATSGCLDRRHHITLRPRHLPRPPRARQQLQLFLSSPQLHASQASQLT